MKIFYRLSDGSYSKIRFDNATKKNCLRNFLGQFRDPMDDMFLYLDNVSDNTFKMASDVLEQNCGMGRQVMRTNVGSSAGSFRHVMERALWYDDDDIVYFVEDDYAHLPGSRAVLLEGLERSHYVTLYNHPDKYIPASQGGNPWVADDGGEATKVFVTKSSYWMLTNSTTMTFATRVQYLREDQDTWKKHTKESYPQDMKIFVELRQRDRTLIQPIPTRATHCEPAWAAHLHGTGITDWNKHLIPRRVEFEPIDKRVSDDKS